MRPVPSKHRSTNTVCLAAILKDEDCFVEEWVAYHRLLGVDYFYLYDNDPRQPLSDILARHRDYVSVYSWLIDHNDQRYPGRTKQIKAYIHCLEHAAADYAWVTFIDCDEFIVLEEHRDLQAFLHDFETYDSIALNWHVFGHNGYYDDPPGLVIESLTRRMKEPRPITKCISRPDAIASIDSAHLCRLKKGRQCVDANKRPYRVELYPGKTRVAHINHYQCRSFTNWMRKPERGEVGTDADDPANAWRFSKESCLRQFVRQIALDKNEHVDTSMVPHAKAIRHYLSHLRNNSQIENGSLQNIGLAPTGQRSRPANGSLPIQSSPDRTALAQCENVIRDYKCAVSTRIARSLRLASVASSLLARDVARAPSFFWVLLNAQFSLAAAMLSYRRRRNALAYASAASRAHDWPDAIRRWEMVIEEFGDDVPPAAFVALCKAHRYLADFTAAEAAVQRGQAKHPTNIRLAISYAETAMARNSWPEAIVRWREILDKLNGSAPAEVYGHLVSAYLRQGNNDQANEVLHWGLSKYPKDIRLTRRYAESAMARKHWPEAAATGAAILHELAGSAPAEVYLQLSRAHRQQGNLEKAEHLVHEGLAKHFDDIRLLTEEIEIAWARKDCCHLGKKCHAAMNMIEAHPDSVLYDRHFATVCNGLMRSHDYDRVISAVQHAKRREGESKLLLAIEGIAYLRAARTEVARALWNQYWQRALHERDFAQQRAPVLASFTHPSQNFFAALCPTADFILDGADTRFCVYTTLFGDYDDLRSPAYVPPGLKFICFSDKERHIAGWDVRVVDLELDSPAMKSRKLKILPYEYLEGYDQSLYIDANIVLLGDPRVAYCRYLKDKPFVAWPHPQRSSVYEEIEAILVSHRDEPSSLLDQHTHFGDHAVPEQTGLIEACFLWRDHRDPAVRELMEQWWEHLVSFESYRDQPALGYLMWRMGIRPAVLPEYLGTSRNNDFFCKLPHKRTALELKWEDAAECRGKDRIDALANQKVTRWRGKSRRAANRRRRLTWVYRDKFRTVASTLMRGHQLSDIAKVRLVDADVSCVDERHLGTQFDSVLILTKGFLKETSVDELAGLKKQGNIICADYLDDLVRDEVHEFVDVYIASSITQFLQYAKRYANKLVHMITHHADPRLNGIKGPDDYCNIGYFGEIANARYASELQGIIDFCLTDTKVAGEVWVSRLRHCNVHYAVRKLRAIDGFKPFLKGFTAAQCHSNIIVPRDESDVRHYLGSDYPYILNDGTLNSVLEMIDFANASFGGSEWRRGLEIMKSVRQRCDPAQIQGEIRALLTHCY